MAALPDPETRQDGAPEATAEAASVEDLSAEDLSAEVGAQSRPLRRCLVLRESFARETMLRLLDASKRGDGVQIFIGAQSHLFGLAGCSVIIAPYQNSREEIVGAIGVIGPTRINYARIIPMVDYTAKVIGRLIG